MRLHKVCVHILLDLPATGAESCELIRSVACEHQFVANEIAFGLKTDFESLSRTVEFRWEKANRIGPFPRGHHQFAAKK